MTQPPTPQPGQPFDPNKIPTDPQQAAAWAQQQQAAAWQQHAAWQQQAAQQAAQEAQEEAHQEYLEQQAAAAKKPAFGGIRGIISLIVGLVVVGASAYGAWTYFQTSQNLQVGNCLVMSGSVDDANEKKVDCDKEDFSWKVVSVVKTEDLCPAEETISYTVGGKGRRGANRSKVACLSPNFLEGKCYVDSGDLVMPYKSVECAPGAQEVSKITKVIEQANATCEEPTFPVSYPTMKRTYCVEPVA